VKDINPGSGYSRILEIADVNGKLYISAQDDLHGRELWTSDGTNTVRAQDINSGGASSDPTGLTDVNGTLFFSADDGSHGREPWALDVANFSIQTVTIDIKPGSESNPVNLASNGMIAVSVFTTDDFDATQIDASTVFFAGAYAAQSAFEDVDGDGDLDMILHFRVQDTGLEALYGQLLLDDMDADGVLDSTNQEAEVSLSGETYNDLLFEGYDELDLSLHGRALRELLIDLFAEPDPGGGT
jgi:ELWxxDGT repeat protein